MSEILEKQCPRTEALSALMDGQLTERERSDLTAHARLCPVCGAMIEDFVRLREALQPLAHTRLDRDLSPLIDARLSAASGRPPMATAGPRVRRRGWQLAPAGLVAAGVFGVGVYLGALLAGGAAAMPSRPAAMAVFDAVPPGALCIGVSCVPGSR